MDSGTIATVAEILRQNEQIVYDWKLFKDKLAINNDTKFLQLSRLFNSGDLPVYELFKEIITKWSNLNGAEATTIRLSEILSQLDHKDLAEKIKKVPPASLLVPIYWEVKKTALNLLLCMILILSFLGAFPGSLEFATSYWSQNPTRFNDQNFDVPFISRNLPKPTFNFVGRFKEIRQLSFEFKQSSTFLVKVVGMAGVGKSELVKSFAKILRNDANIIWLNGDNMENLKKSVYQVANTVNVPCFINSRQRDYLDVFVEIIQAIGINKLRTIIIVDNLNIHNAGAAELVSKSRDCECFVLVTSRNISVLGGDAGETLHLNVLGDREAHQLVQQSMNDESEADIIALLNLVQNFPLVLQQAIGFIKQQQIIGLFGHKYKIRNYIMDYDIHKTRLLNFTLNKIDHYYEETLFITWNITVNQILQRGELGQLALLLFQKIAYLKTDQINVETLKVLDSHSSEEIEMALMILKDFTLIKIEEYNIFVHRLVKEVTRINTFVSNNEFSILRELLNKAILIKDDLKRSEMNHIISIWNHSKKYEELLTEFSHFPFSMTETFTRLSMYQQLLHFSKENMIILKELYGNNHTKTMKMEEEFALAMRYNGNIGGALENLSVLYEKRSTLDGDYEQATLVTAYNLASTIYLTGRINEAKQLYLTVLNKMEANHRENAFQIMLVKQGIAIALTAQSKHEEAMLIFNDVVEWQEAELGSENRATLETRHNIAMWLYRQHKYKQAKDMFEIVLEAELRVSGENHSSTLTSKFMLALTLYEINKQRDGLVMLKEVLDSRKKEFGERHPETIETFYALHIFYLIYGLDLLAALLIIVGFIVYLLLKLGANFQLNETFLVLLLYFNLLADVHFFCRFFRLYYYTFRF